jgi:dTDP-glucose 4,6-dehydratase
LVSAVTEPVNLGNPDEISIRDFAYEVREITESNSEVIFRPLPEDDPKVRRPDVTKAHDLLGWEPKVSRQDGLRRTFSFFQKSVQTAGRTV